MRWTSILAIYVLFWTMSLFLVLPFGVRTAEEEGERAPARPCRKRAAPLQLRPRRAARDASLARDPVPALYYANYIYGWITRRGSRLAELILPRMGRTSAPQPLDRLGQRDVELAHVGGEQGDAERRAVAVGEDAAQHRLEIVDVAVHLVAEVGLVLVMAQDLARLARIRAAAPRAG